MELCGVSHVSVELLALVAIVQGLTEFLPVSSSGHLILAPELMEYQDQGPVIDVAVHVGSLLAVMLYLWRDIGHMLRGMWRGLRGRKDPGLILALQIIFATIPLVAAGYASSRYLGDMLRSVEVVACATIGFGILLYLADQAGMTIKRVEHMSFGGALLIGLAQVLALIPGTSRSGITMTAARFLGYERPDAARFSMLLGIPAIVAAGSLTGFDLYKSDDMQLTMEALIAGGMAFVAALVSIILMMAWLKRAGYGIFVVYRLILGAGLLAWLYL